MTKLLRRLWQVGLTKPTLPSKTQGCVRKISVLSMNNKQNSGFMNGGTSLTITQTNSSASGLLKHAAACVGYSVPRRHYPRRAASDSADDVQTEHDYDPYQEYSAPSPFKVPLVDRSYGYSPKFYTGGPLPRPKGIYQDQPLKSMKQDFPGQRDQWTKAKALFGQNDYIDILGDGELHPWQLYKAPVWLKGWKGNELQRLIRQKRYMGKQMKHMYPTQYHNLNKRIFFLWKKVNIKRSSQPFWGNRRRAQRGRLDRPLLFP